MTGRTPALWVLLAALVACGGTDEPNDDSRSPAGGSAGTSSSAGSAGTSGSGTAGNAGGPAGTGGAPSAGGAAASGGVAAAGIGGVAGQSGTLGNAGGAQGGSFAGGNGGTEPEGASGAGGSAAGAAGASAGNAGTGGAGAGGAANGGAGSSAGGASGAAAFAGTSGAGNGGSSAGSAGTNNGGTNSAGTSNAGAGGSGNPGGNGGNAGTAGTAGASGSAGSASTGLVGWASVSGSGVTTTTGGGNATPMDVSTESALVSAVAGGTARVIRISGTISITGSDLLDVGSNKTLVGVGSNATIVGGIKIDGESNVIVQNLHVNAKTAAGVGDGITVNTAHHVWVDHCEVWDAPDGNLDITDGSDFVTVSWSKFWYSTSPANDAHRFSNLIGGSDTSTTDTGKLRVTYHHNWWADRVVERMPRGRFGLIHVFNNYHTATGNTRGVQAGTQARMLVENNAFVGTNNPHITTEDGQILASGNSYSGTTGSQSNNGTFARSLFTYAYTLDPVASVPALVQAGVGPR